MPTEPITDIDDDDDERTKWSLWAIAAAAVLVLLFGIIAVGTLRGCFYTDPLEAAKTDEEKIKEEEKKKEQEFVIAPPVVQPAEAESPFQPVKPGHWAATSQKMRANYRDFVGDSRTSIVNSTGAPYAVPYTPFVLRASRPVLLTKGRPKATGTTLYVPPTDQALRVSTTLEERGLGPSFAQVTQLTRMPSYQYHFAVLAKEPTRYSFVKSLDSVKVPFDGESDADDTEDPLLYRVALLDISQAIPLPDNPLTWTSIAYLLWDEVDPALFTNEQERALVDWLHWGGQLIVSGPDSLDLLKDSFLAPYLPATSAGPKTIAANDTALVEFNKGWMISTSRLPGEPLKSTAPWSAIKLNIHEGARALPNTGELFAERQVGRGRIVVSAMQLAERDLVNWRSGFESFFNACLLHRPQREFRQGFFGDVTLAWSEPSLVGRRLDARLNTNIRYLARDLGVEQSYRREEVFDEANQVSQQFNRFGQQEIPTEYKPPDAAGGIGAWNDFSLSANAAREALREAAGVEVPGAGFVVMCLAVYLIALVPLNWLVFHTLGRVEWAWIAAPIIAIAGTMIVVERAQLDIGFVRAQTEVGLLEQQPDHPRALHSRFTALYTSLSTTYDLEFGNLTTLVAPFPTEDDYQLLARQGVSSVDFLRYDNVRLSGVPISSNSTGMVHSEQMLSLDGPIRLGRSSTGGNQIENRSKFLLRSACVVRRPLQTDQSLRGVTLEGTWMGELLPGQSTPLLLQPQRLRFYRSRGDVPETALADLLKNANARQQYEQTRSIVLDESQWQNLREDLRQWFVCAPFIQERISEARVQGAERLNLEPMFCLALNPEYMETGEMRLVARVDEVLPGQTIMPDASQVRGATLIVAHLEYAPPPPPKKDRNTKRDIKADAEQQDEEQLEMEF